MSWVTDQHQRAHSWTSAMADLLQLLLLEYFTRACATLEETRWLHISLISATGFLGCSIVLHPYTACHT